MNLQTIIFIGRSGCGKGTQRELLKKYIQKNDPGRQIFELETGARFREFVKEDSYSAKLTKQIIDNGGLLPSFLPIKFP